MRFSEFTIPGSSLGQADSRGNRANKPSIASRMVIPAHIDGGVVKSVVPDLYPLRISPSIARANGTSLVTRDSTLQCRFGK
jgi:hypothetical protein